MCGEYLRRHLLFPEDGRIDEEFFISMNEVFNELFSSYISGDQLNQPLIISEEVVIRAIDLVSGQLQQMNILMDDSNAPTWAGSQSRSVVVLPVNDCQSNVQRKCVHKKKKKNAGL